MWNFTWQMHQMRIPMIVKSNMFPWTLYFNAPFRVVDSFLCFIHPIKLLKVQSCNAQTSSQNVTKQFKSVDICPIKMKLQHKLGEYNTLLCILFLLKCTSRSLLGMVFLSFGKVTLMSITIWTTQDHHSYDKRHHYLTSKYPYLTKFHGLSWECLSSSKPFVPSLKRDWVWQLDSGCHGDLC